MDKVCGYGWDSGVWIRCVGYGWDSGVWIRCVGMGGIVEYG